MDSSDYVEAIGRIGRRHGVTIPVSLEMDPSVDLPGLRLGARRSRLRTKEQMAEVMETLCRSLHVSPEGAMGYEARIAGVPDRVQHGSV